MYKVLFLTLLFFSCMDGSKIVQEKKVEIKPEIGAEIYIEKHKNGQVKIKGNLVNKLRQGKWESFYENGSKWSESVYLFGKRNGISKGFYSNGNLKFHGTYRDEKKVGIWFFYLENGKFEKEVDFGNFMSEKK